MAVIAFGEWAPLLLAPETIAPTEARPQWYAMLSGSTRMSSTSTSRRTTASAVTRFPRDFIMLTIEAFLSVARLDSR